MHRSLARLLILALPLVALSGCKKPEYPACKKDKHCKTDLDEKCVDGTCQNCQSDGDCADKAPEGKNFVCHEFRCQDPAEIVAGEDGGGSGEQGAPCTARTDCIGGLVCTAGACDFCQDDVECSPSTCTQETGRCAAAGQCTTDDECPIDEICDGGMCLFSGEIGTGENPCGLDAVFFAFDSDALTPKNTEALTTAAQCIIEQNRQVVLEAHADNVGTEEYNILLTERRGQNVSGFLSGAGVPAELLQVIAKGSLEASGSNESERSKDRRVELIFPQ